MKAAAARAGLRVRFNRRRIVQIRQARHKISARILAHPGHLRAGHIRHDHFSKAGKGAARFDPVATPATLAGSTVHFHVYYANVLGQAGDQVAQAVLKNCERDYGTVAGFFGQQKSIQFNVIVAPLSRQMDGTGGAYHHSCQAIDLYCDVQLTPTINPDVTNALVIAEEVEVFQATQGGGWNCGGSNGEGLSRVLAEDVYPQVLERLGYYSARFWLNSRRPNFVGRTLPTDQNMIGNGCAVLFLNYLHVQLGIGWDKISQAAAPTLAGTYKTLTGKTAPFLEFASLLETKFPKGQRTGLATDNPFPIASAKPATQAPERSRKKLSTSLSDRPPWQLITAGAERASKAISEFWGLAMILHLEEIALS